jgi:cob(I)alamin adenosyltransferase
MHHREARPVHHLEKGFVHCYTGSGKGKTTAALGLALRAAGAGLSVFIVQFAKGTDTSELKALRKFTKNITVRQFGTRAFIKNPPSGIDRMRAAHGLAAAKSVIASGRYDLVILDEVCGACHLRLIPTDEIVLAVKARPVTVEVVFTGRNAPKELIEAADIVTECREIKHYYSLGVRARKGIEY